MHSQQIVTRVIYVRHGENPANITREFSCSKVDYGLTSRGVEQALCTATHLANSNIDAIYTSPLRRARETADIVASMLNLSVTVVEQFREVNVGRLEDEPPSPENWAFHDQIFEQWLAGSSEVGFPQGETHTVMLQRMYVGLSMVAAGHPGKRVVVIGHYGILLGTIPFLCDGLDVKNLMNRPGKNCSITELDILVRQNELFNLSFTLRSWSDSAHLKCLP